MGLECVWYVLVCDVPASRAKEAVPVSKLPHSRIHYVLQIVTILRHSSSSIYLPYQPYHNYSIISLSPMPSPTRNIRVRQAHAGASTLDAVIHFHCSQCGLIFSTNQERTRHTRSAHPPNPKPDSSSNSSAVHEPSPPSSSAASSVDLSRSESSESESSELPPEASHPLNNVPPYSYIYDPVSSESGSSSSGSVAGQSQSSDSDTTSSGSTASSTTSSRQLDSRNSTGSSKDASRPASQAGSGSSKDSIDHDNHVRRQFHPIICGA